MVFYASTLIANTALTGDIWEYKLRPTYVIAFLNFDLEEIPEEFNGSAAFEAYFEAAATAAFSKDELAINIKDMTTKWDIELAMKEHLEKGRKEGREERINSQIVRINFKFISHNVRIKSGSTKNFGI